MAFFSFIAIQGLFWCKIFICSYLNIFREGSTSDICSWPWEMGPRAFNSMILKPYTPFLAPITWTKCPETFSAPAAPIFFQGFLIITQGVFSRAGWNSIFFENEYVMNMYEYVSCHKYKTLLLKKISYTAYPNQHLCFSYFSL